MKNNIYGFIMTLFIVRTLTMCDASSKMISVKQSINNLTSDTIIIINSEFRGLGMDTIICYPFLETVFFDKFLIKQPLESYDAPFIGIGSLINVSSGKYLTKNIFEISEWERIFTKDHQWMKFTILEIDLE
jgi:hypothetical protein